MFDLTLFAPAELLHPGDQGWPDFGPYRYQYLAQGDSWFSIGALPPSFTTNLLSELDLKAKAFAVNCAHPGFTLRRMVDRIRDPNFTQLLVGHQSWKWDGLLLSAGGNDLIDALQVMPRYGNHHPQDGEMVPAGLRLLLRPDEWKPGATADRYVSDAGWAAFSTYLKALFTELQNLRDSPHSQSQGVPVVVHCYDYLLARNAPAGLGAGPWLQPAMLAYQIPPADWQALGEVLIERFEALLRSVAMPNLHIVDSAGTLVPAVAGSTGTSNDWVNEIHPTAGGYKKLAVKYGAVVDQIFP